MERKRITFIVLTSTLAAVIAIVIMAPTLLPRQSIKLKNFIISTM